MAKLIETLTHTFSNSELWLSWSGTALKIILIFIAARIIISVLGRTFKHIAEEKDRMRFNPRRTTTIVRLMGNIVKYVINFVMILMILGELGVPIGPILAGAGVLGLAIGFGAQSLVKDIITGFFIIIEDQFAIDDVVQIGSYKGTVEEIGLRVTRIKGWTGEVYIIPNGSIANVTNFTLNNSIAIIDLSFAYETDVDRVMEIIKESVKKASRNSGTIMKTPEVLGMQTIGAGAVVIRVACECKPNSQSDAVRLLNGELKKDLDVHGMKILTSSSQV